MIRDSFNKQIQDPEVEGTLVSQDGEPQRRTFYCNVAIYKRGREYKKDDPIELDEATARRFLELKEIREAK